MDDDTAAVGILGDLRLAAVVLAAGAGRRFGGHKLEAELHGRPLLQHVLDTLQQVRPVMTMVVMGPDMGLVERITWHGEQRVVNQDPTRGLSSSVRRGIDVCAADERLDGAFILLGDQPLTAASTLVTLSAAAPRAINDGALAVLPSYEDGGGANPVLLLRAGFPLVALVAGDHGLGSVLAERPDQLCRVPIPGKNPDVDTVADLRAIESGP